VILEVERVAHGGVCVAHADDGRVVLVRHTLPGEQVRVQVTEQRRSYLRADAVEVLRASPARVAPPCPWAGPGRCGGCDWQHVDLAEQRRLKSIVVKEQLSRLAGVDRDVVVAAVPGDETGLHWRSRLRLATDARGRAGLRRHRSHEIEPIGDCLIAAPAAEVPALLQRHWPPDVEVTVDVSTTGERAVAVGTHAETVTEQAAGREWSVPVGGFWQVHVGAADLLARTVLEVAGPLPTDRCLDLYAGVGLFAGALAQHVAAVIAVESDRRAAAAARRNLAELPVTVVGDRVDRWLGAYGAPDLDRRPDQDRPDQDRPDQDRPDQDRKADVVVLDPPRKGAGRDVVTRIAATGARSIVYVACDPAALARDTATLRELGYRLGDLRAYDLFPMTAHVECIALFSRGSTP
jgi:tRNA/tmRNA/rRNA uracil-C5-methylase (TrmA/RlmC/RlmD family)